MYIQSLRGYRLIVSLVIALDIFSHKEKRGGGNNYLGTDTRVVETSR